MTSIEIEQAATAADALMRGRAVVVSASAADPVELPEAAIAVLTDALEHLRRGHQVRVIADDEEVTTQAAADLLNVSRQYLVRLLDADRMPFRKTGKHRRLRIEDVLEFKEKRDKDRRAGLRELSRVTQELGGYEAELK